MRNQKELPADYIQELTSNVEREIGEISHEKKLEIKAWVIGVLCGSGSVKRRMISLARTRKKEDHEFVAQFKYYFEIAFEINGKLKPIEKHTNIGIIFQAFDRSVSVALGDLKKDSWLNTVRKSHSWILEREDYLISFLKGFFEANGHFTDRYMRISTYSEEIFLFIKQKLTRYQIHGSEKRNKLTGNIVYIDINNKASADKFIRLLLRSNLEYKRAHYERYLNELNFVDNFGLDELLGYEITRALAIRGMKPAESTAFLEQKYKIKVKSGRVKAWLRDVVNPHIKRQKETNTKEVAKYALSRLRTTYGIQHYQLEKLFELIDNCPNLSEGNILWQLEKIIFQFFLRKNKIFEKGFFSEHLIRASQRLTERIEQEKLIAHYVFIGKKLFISILPDLSLNELDDQIEKLIEAIKVYNSTQLIARRNSDPGNSDLEELSTAEKILSLGRVLLESTTFEELERKMVMLKTQTKLLTYYKNGIEIRRKPN